MAPVWDGGMIAFKPRMQYSAMTFSAPTRVTFDALYRPSVSVAAPPTTRPGGPAPFITSPARRRSSSGTCTSR